MTAALKFAKPVRVKKPRKQLRTRGPMKRTGPIQRKTWMKHRRPRRIDAVIREVMVNDFDGTGPRMETRPGTNEERLIWCRQQPCYRCGIDPIQGFPSQACHEGRTGKGAALKCPGDETFPMCADCHRQWTDGQSTNGFARHWNKAKRREWADEMVALATSRFKGHGGRRGAQ